MNIRTEYMPEFFFKQKPVLDFLNVTDLASALTSCIQDTGFKLLQLYSGIRKKQLN